jgi:hypothetical protein
MGYAGYAPTKYAVTKTDLQLALAAVGDAATLDLLATLSRNAVVSPADPKYRRIKRDNARVVAARAASGEEAFEKAMALLGWKPSDGGAAYELPAGVATMAHVRDIEDAKVDLKKAARAVTVKAVSGSERLGADGDAVRAAIAADAAERAAAAKEPVKAAKAQPLPGGGGEVARLNNAD